MKEIYIEIVAFAIYYLRACIVLWVTRPFVIMRSFQEE